MKNVILESIRDRLEGGKIWSKLFQFLVSLMRIFFGVGWLLAGVTKITGKSGETSWFSHPEEFLEEYLTKALSKGNVPDFYKLFIEHFALNHVTFFNYAIPVAQIMIGMFLIFGFLIIPSVSVALFMHINFILSGNMNLLSLTLYTTAFVMIFCLRRVYFFSLDRYLGLEQTFAGKRRIIFLVNDENENQYQNNYL
ncbi:thiosulfate dehydrogenase [quinone] large subunit [Paenibacillus sp. yr247]|uniref:DoxX family membrane protein n=1 Tax=Paenibacillus sp. yr247 TaxID=1761880 RepID=UPI000887051A|nr:DoxX family membrane protein [Paenibacillus sp. yr247]SDP28914.1 thiosulfate dehydrogenase [quinone] large subunit [Paenibacillus sp. yr247]